MENSLYYYAILNFSVWLRTGSNPANINRFRSHTGKKNNNELINKLLSLATIGKILRKYFWGKDLLIGRACMTKPWVTL